jgi:TonB-dependent starch-binding outer membrane protein SusC
MKKLSLVFALLLLGSAALWAQKTITGKVTDDNGEALIGASILVKGTVKGTITDIEGSFTLAIPEGSNVLQISYTGFKAQEVTLGAETTLTIIMETDAIGLDETVVVAYGTQSNRFRVQSIGTVSAENIKNVPLLGPQCREFWVPQQLLGFVAHPQSTLGVTHCL